MSSSWKPRHVVAICISLAVGVIAGPVAVQAATGTIVNIADPTTASQVAKVDASGRLSTVSAVSGTVAVGSGTVSARPYTATTPLSGNKEIPGYHTTSSQTIVLGPTTSVVGLTHMTFANDATNVDPWEAAVRLVPGNTVSDCRTNFFASTSKQITLVNVGVDGTVDSDFSNPYVTKPITGSGFTSYCVGVVAGPRTVTGANNGTMSFSWSGLLVSGTVPTTASAAPHSAGKVK
jgi:hypothetical protein